MNLDISEIEKAVIARIKDQLPYIETCESWSAFRTGELKDNTLAYPAAYTVFDRSGTFLYTADQIQDIPLTFRVVVMQRTLGIDVSGAESRQGDNSQVKGVYEILNDLRLALTGYRDSTDLDVLKPILPQSIQSIFQDENIAIYGMVLELTERYSHNG